MKIRILEFLLILANLAAVSAQNGDYSILEEPPLLIVINEASNYPYIPSNNVYAPVGFYLADTNPLGNLVPLTSSSTYCNASKCGVNINEKLIGGWDLTKPVSVWNNNCFYAYFMPYKGFTPSAADYPSHCVGDYQQDAKIYYIAAIDNETLIIDMTTDAGNFIVYYSLANNSALSNCSTKFESSFGPSRAVSYYSFGDRAFVYRLSSIIEIFDATNPMNITLAYVYNQTNISPQFNPQNAQIFLGDIFVASNTDMTIYRIAPVNNDYANINISRINVTDACFNLKVYYDVSYQTTSLSVIILCSTYIMRIDWTDFYSPIIVESYSSYYSACPYCNSVSGYGTIAASSSFNFATFYAGGGVLWPAMYYRKTPIQGSLIGVSIPDDIHYSTGLISFLDIDQNYMLTSETTENAYLLQPPIYYLNSSVIQGDHELIIWIGSSPTQEIYNYSQPVFLSTSSAPTGVFYNSSAIPLIVTPQTSSYYVPLLSVISLSDPTSILPTNTSILNGTLLSRTNSFDMGLYNQSYPFQNIVTNPNFRNDTFFWITQEAESPDIVFKQCIMTQTYQEVAWLEVCNTLGSISLSPTEQIVGAVLISNDSSPNNIIYGVQTTQNSSSTVYIYNSDQDPLYKVPIDSSYGKLQYTRYGGTNQLIYCYSQDNILFWSPLSAFAVNGSTLNMPSFAVLNIETSPNYKDVLFIQTNLTTIKVLFMTLAPQYFVILSSITLPTRINSFAISEKFLIALNSSSSFLVYDISNVRDPYLLNTFPEPTGSYTSILSSGSRIFLPATSSVKSNQLGLFDSQLPDISQLYTLYNNYNNMITAMQYGNSELLFWVNSENQLSITQFFHYLRFQITLAEPSSYQTTPCLDLAFPQKEDFIYPFCFLIYAPIENIAAGLPVSKSWNLTNVTQSTFVLQGDISDYFTGPISGSIQVSPEYSNETNFFNITNLVHVTSCNISLSPSDQILFSTEFNGFIYLLVNTSQTYKIYQLTMNGPESNAVPLMTVSVPDSVPQNWQCTSFFVSTNDTIRYWFVIPCANLYKEEVVVIYQSMNTTLASYVTASLDTLVRARTANNTYVNGINDCLLLLGYQAGNPTLCMYLIEAQVFCNKLGSELNSLTLSFTDFDAINIIDFRNSWTSIQVMLLESTGGIWSVNLDLQPKQPLDYVVGLIYSKFSLEFENIVPSLIGVEILGDNYDNYGCRIAIVSEYGGIYLASLNAENGEIGSWSQYNSYSNWTNLPSIQFSSSEMFVLARDSNQNNPQILRYDLYSTLHDPIGVFPTQTPSLGEFEGDYQLWTIDENNFLNIINVSSDFTVTFTGNSSDLSSNYIDVRASGGYQNAWGASRITLNLPIPPIPPTPPVPPNPSPPINYTLIIIIGVVTIIVIILGYYCWKSWKARRRVAAISLNINDRESSSSRLLPGNRDSSLRVYNNGSRIHHSDAQPPPVNRKPPIKNNPKPQNKDKKPVPAEPVVAKPVVKEENNDGMNQIKEENNNGMNQNNKDQEDDRNLCTICLSAAKEWIFHPCNHIATCEACSKEILNKNAQCPICREAVTSSNKVYFA